MWGFQLWINLPGNLKMSPPEYQEFDKHEIPIEKHSDGAVIRIISGTTLQGTVGPVKNIPTAPLYIDFELPHGIEISQPVSSESNTFIYVYEGTVEILSEKEPVILEQGILGVLENGDGVQVRGVTPVSRSLLLAAQPLREPVAWAGPFVMNTRGEIMRAFQDYNNGLF